MNIFIVARTCEEVGVLNRGCPLHQDCFHEDAYGDIVFVGSDEEGNETDIDVDSLTRFWKETKSEYQNDSSSS